MRRVALFVPTLVVSALSVFQACTSREIVGVIVGDVGIRPSEATVYVGDSLQLTAVVRDDGGQVLEGAEPQWTSTATTVAVVDPAGRVRALRAGVAEVRASFRGESASATILVAPAPVYDLVVNQSGGTTVVSEGGARDDFTVALTSPPVQDVVLEITSGDEGEARLDPTSLTFGEADWDVERTVEVLGVDDTQVDGDQTTTVTVSVDVARSDPLYSEASPKSFDVLIQDDDIGGFGVFETGESTSATEGGSTDSLSVVLDVQPVADVYLALSVDDPTDASLAPDTLTFTSEDWDSPHLVTFTALDDSVADGTRSRTISVWVAAGSDAGFLGLPPVTLNGMTVDDEVGGWTLAHTGENTVATEGGAPDSISVALAAVPASVVVLDVAVEERTDAEVSPETLTFTVDDATTQWVTFAAVDDPDLDGARTHTVSVSVSPASDPAFLGLPTQSIEASTADDDVAGFTVSESGGVTTVDENGGSDALVIELGARPASEVSFRIVSGDLSEAVVSPEIVTFTPETWDQPRSVTVTGVDDDMGDGDQETELSVEVDPGSDPAFAGLSPWIGSVITVDDDGIGITVGETEGTIVNEPGTLTDAIAVRLTAVPVDTVVLDVTSGDAGEVTVSPPTLTFTSDNGGDPQAVVVSGVDDAVPDGDVVTGVSVAVNLDLTRDPAYDTVSARTVFVTTLDDDLGSFTVTETDGDTKVDESGTSDQIVLALGAEPLSDVTLIVTSADVGEVEVDHETVKFAPKDWNKSKTVKVTGVDDGIVDGSAFTDVTIAVHPSSDPAFLGLPPQIVTVETTDDEEPAFEIVQTEGETIVTEGGSSDTFDVIMSYRPHRYVTIVATSPDPGEVVVSPPGITFTRDDWEGPRTFTVTGIDDSIADGDQITLILLSPQSTHDHDVENVPERTLAVTTVDDEPPGD